MWKVVEFDSDEVGAERPSFVYQFDINLMCVEVFQETGTGLWLGVLIDADGDEMWVSDAVDSSYRASYLALQHLRECFASWLNEMARELP